MHPAVPRLVSPLVSLLLTLGLVFPATAAEPTPAPAPAPKEAAPAPAPKEAAPTARPEDVATPEALVTAMYDVISGPKGQARDWQRFRSLFASGARLIAVDNHQGSLRHQVLTPEDYIRHAGPLLVKSGFHERELHRVEERFGPLVHVFSTYEGLRDGDAQPFVRGINSLQLMHDGQRWWVLSIYWTPETPELPLPARYLPASGH